MKQLIKEAAIDDRFNVHMKRVQTAIAELQEIVHEMKKPGSLTKPTGTQIMSLKYAAEDFKKLAQKAAE